MEEAYLGVFPVLRAGVVARAAGVFFRNVCLRASHRATLVRSGSCSLTSWKRRFCRWAGMHAGRMRRVVEGDCQFLPELLDVRSAVRFAEHAGNMLDGVRGNGMLCRVRYRGRLLAPSPGSDGAPVWGVSVGGVCGFGPGRAPRGFAGA